MKRLTLSFLSALALIFTVWVGVPMLITSCGTTGQRATVNTLFTTGQAVDAAFKSYLDLVVTHQLPTNDVPRIAKLYSEFQGAFNAAVTLAAFNTNAPPTPELLNSSSQLILAIKAVKGK